MLQEKLSGATDSEIASFCAFCGVSVHDILYIPFIGDLFQRYKYAADHGIDFEGSGLRHFYRYNGKLYGTDSFISAINLGYDTVKAEGL